MLRWTARLYWYQEKKPLLSILPFGGWLSCEQKDYVDQFQMIHLNIQTAKIPMTRQQVEEEEPIVENATQKVRKGAISLLQQMEMSAVIFTFWAFQATLHSK